MSDIFDFNGDYNNPSQNNEYTQSRNEYWAKKNERRQQINEEYQQDLDRYSVNISQEDYNIIKDAIANAEVPEDEAYRWACAMELNKQYDMPVAYAYQNLEQINAAKWGDRFTFTPKTNFKAIVDSGRLGANTLKMGRLGSKIMKAQMFGKTEYNNYLAGKIESLDDMMAQYEALEQESAQLTDLEDRNLAIEALKFAAQSAPYTGYVAGVGLLGGLLSGGAGTAAAFAVSMDNAAGLEYMRLRKAGSDVGDAAGFAILSGGLQALVETSLGNVAGALGKSSLGDLASQAVKNKITGNVFKRLAYNGTFKDLALRMGKEWVKENAEEGLEEVIQDLIEKGTDALAAELGGYEIEGLDAKTVARDAWENFRGGVMGSLILGLGPSVIKQKHDIKEFINVRNLAEVTPSLETFNKFTEDSTLWEGMSDEEKKNAQKTTWENAQARVEAAATAEAKKIAEGRDAAEGAEEGPAENEDGSTEANPVARDERGRLYTSDDVSTDDAGNVTGGTFVVGDKTKSENNRYGYIKYSQDAEGNITIDNFKMTEGRDKLRAEAFDEFARQHPDVNIEWNATAPDLQDFKNELIDANPSGKKNGLNYYSTTDLDNIQARKRVAEELRKNIHNIEDLGNNNYRKTELTNKQIAAGVTLIESAARRMNMGLAEYVNKTFGSQIFGSSEEFASASLAQGENVNKKAGGMKQGVAQANWREVGQQIKAVIYAGEKADFSTWAHEMAHVFQNQLEGQLKTDAENAFNVKGGDWYNSYYTFKDGRKMRSAEAFAWGFQDWLETGKAENEQMRNIFQKFAEFIADCYNRLKNHLDFTPEIESVFNQLLDGDDTIMSKALKAAQEQDNEYRASLKRQAEEKQAAKEAAAEQAKQQAEATREEASEGTEFTEAEPTAEELLNNVEEVENETKETTEETNAIDNALENTNLTDEEKGRVADVLKDENSTIVEKAEATTEAAESAYDEDAPYDLFQNEGALLSQLIGEPAIQKMAKSALQKQILDKLKLAVMFDEKGVDALQIRYATGWEKDGAGEWKYETDDSINKIKDFEAIYRAAKTGESLKVKNVLDAEKLYEILPFIKDLNVRFSTAPSNQSVDIDQNGIVIFTKTLEGVEGENGLKGALAEAIQYYIQVYEYANNNEEFKNKVLDIHNKRTQLVINMQKAQAAKELNVKYDAISLRNQINNILQDRGIIEARNVARRVMYDALKRKDKRIAETEEKQQLLSQEENPDFLEAVNKAQDLLFKNKISRILFQDEINTIRKQYENTDQWMKAPNGADSKLNEKQWLQVRTPSFKKWFGDWEKDPQNASKVVDTNGEPLVVYHGTKTKGVTVFDRSKIGSQTDQGIAGRGFYFTPDKMYTLNYTDNNDRNIIAAFLNIRNPYRLNDSTMKEFNDMYMKYTEGEYEEEYYQNLLKNPQTAFGDALEKGNEELIKKNYDGVIFSYDLRDEYVAFNSNQIKSATDNNGNFDPANPNILFQVIGEIGAQNLDDAEVQEGVSRMQNLVIAKQMETDGKDAKAIRLATGWEKGADGKWRWEIDDSKVHFDSFGMIDFDKSHPRLNELTQKLIDGKTLTDSEQKEFDELNAEYGKVYDEQNNSEAVNYFGKKLELSKILDHEELFKAYPKLKNIIVEFKPQAKDGTAGSYNELDNVITLYVNSKDEWLKQYNLKSVLLHEVQHAIQRIEGFAKGGNVNQFKPRIRTEDEIIKRDLQWTENLEDSYPDKKAEMQEIKSLMLDGNRNQAWEKIHALQKEAIEKDDRDYARYIDEYGWKLDKIQRNIITEDVESPEQQYRRLAGETESRNVQTRINFTPEERREALLAATEDVAPEDKIILFQSINTAEQMEQTRSDAFKRWFGDWENDPQNASKVVDENGKPMVMYHETGNQFDTFDPRHGGAGNTDYMFPYGIFTKPTDKNIGVARNPIQMPLFVNMKKPLEVYSREDLENYLKNNVPGFKEDLEKLQNTDKEYEAKYDAAEKEYDAAFDDIYENHPEIWEDDAKRIAFGEEAEKPLNRILEEWKDAYAERAKALRNKVDDYFRNSDYDGIILKSDAGSFGRNVSSYVVFDPVQVKSAVNNNGNFDPYNPNILFQIAGEIGAANLDNSEVQEGVSRMENLAIAKQMDAEGKDAKKIRLLTGWEKGSDKKWRYEIDDGVFTRPQEGTKWETKDGKTIQVPKLQREGYLREFYKNPELYKAYSDLESVWISFKDFPEGESGSTYTYNGNVHIEINEKDSIEEQKNTLVHEIQHIIQHVEGFAKGGSMALAAKYIEDQNNTKKEIQDKALAWSWKKELEAEEKKHPELRGQTYLMDALINEYKEDGYDLARLEKEGWIPSLDIRYKGFNLYVRGYDKEGFEDAYNEWSNGKLSDYKPKTNNQMAQYLTYRRFGGEVESRNVEKRKDFTPNQRRLYLLAATEDVAPEDQIILFQTVYYESENEQIVDKLLFQTNAELMDEARTFDNWQEFMEYCEAFHADDEVSPIPSDADAQWYQTFYETSNGVKTEQEKNEEALKATAKKDTQLPVAVDALFTTMIASDPEMVDSFLQAVADIDAIDLDSEEWQQAENAEDAAQRDKIEQLKDFINITLSDYNWQTALKRVQGGHEISEGLRKRLIGEMTDSFKARDFRALYAEVMNDEQYAVAPEDSITAVLNKKLKKYHDIVKPTDDVARWSPERRKQLAEQLANRELADKIRRGDLKLDDELDAYIKSLNKQIKEKQKQFDELEAETKADYQRIADKERRDLLKLHEQLLLARGKLKTRNQEIERKIKKGLKITEKYRAYTQNMNANYDEIFRKYSDLRNTITISAEVQAALDRQEQVAGLREDLNAKQKEKNLTSEVKKMRIQLVKRTMRRVPFNRVDYNNARTVIAIQRMLEPNLLGGVNRFIGIDSPYLRGVISQIVTDSDYKESIMAYLSKNTKASQAFADFKKKLTELKSIKDFDSWTAKDRKAAIRYLPKENWVRDLKLKELAKEREESIDLDIGMEEVKRTVYDEKTGEPKTYKDAEGNEHNVTETAFRLKYDDEIGRLVQDAVGADMFDKIVNMPFSEWTTEDLEALAQRIDELYTEGRDLKAAKDEARKKEAAAIRKRIEDAIKETGITINDDDTPEEKERKQKQIEKILGMSDDLKGTEAAKPKGFKAKITRLLHSYSDMNVLRFARMLDGQSEGENVRMLYRNEDDCYNRKQRSMNSRADKIYKVMQDNGITEGDLAETVEFNTIGSKTEFTVDELLYFLAADKDYAEDEKKLQKGLIGLDANDDYAATSRNAVMFGNMMSDMMSQEEKESWLQLDKDMEEALQNDTLTQEQKEQLATGQLDKKPGTTRYIAACHAKWGAILGLANNFLNQNPKFKALMEAIEADYAEQYGRMNEVSINEFNMPVHRVKAYVPLVRRESNGDTNENQVKEDLLGAAGVGKQWADRGMTQRRVNISPLNQKPVQTGLFRTWADSIERTEHFIAYAPYVRQLNAIYKSRDASYTRRFIESRYGAGAIKYLDEYINEVANPNAGRIRERGAEWLHVLRGKTAPAYLGWKASAIIKQGLTSPWPYMQFINPAEYVAAAMKFTFNPEMREAIKEKSVFMKMRRMDPVNDLIDEMADNAKTKLDRGWSNFSKIGMQGLELIDWACVAPGWLACYEKKYNQLQNASNARYEAKMAELKERNMYADIGTSEYLTPQQMEAEAKKEMLEDIEAEAVRYADDCTRQCQPSNRVTDLAPLFKNSSEAMKAFLQFQTSLNVIWQNLRYDMPYAVKNKEFTRIAGTVIGYVCAGIFMNSVMEGIGGDDDDDETQALRNLIYYSTTQFTDSIPIMGSEITNTMDQLITGKRGFYGSGTDMTPSATKLLSVLTNAKKGNWQKAAELTAEGIGLYLGAPVSGAKEINKLLGKPLDNGDVNLARGISDVYGIAGDILEQ